MRLNKTLEENFETLFRFVSLTYAARQSAKLKRRWPLREALIVSPTNVQEALKNLEDLFLELANVKSVRYLEKLPEKESKGWSLASEGNLHVLINVQRDEKLLGEGLMRDLARRVQALRKELGYMPTDILEAVYLAEVDPESVKLLQPFLKEMAELVRTKKVSVQQKRSEVKAEWHEYALDNKRLYIAIVS
ncbi:MAG: DUF5915 domain-containing protein [Candidatus Bathyarchaeia archaeon]